MVRPRLSITDSSESRSVSDGLAMALESASGAAVASTGMTLSTTSTSERTIATRGPNWREILRQGPAGRGAGSSYAGSVSLPFVLATASSPAVWE